MHSRIIPTPRPTQESLHGLWTLYAVTLLILKSLFSAHRKFYKHKTSRDQKLIKEKVIIELICCSRWTVSSFTDVSSAIVACGGAVPRVAAMSVWKQSRAVSFNQGFIVVLWCRSIALKLHRKWLPVPHTNLKLCWNDRQLIQLMNHFVWRWNGAQFVDLLHNVTFSRHLLTAWCY